MNQARPPPSASGIRSLPGSKIIWAKRWEVCARAFRGEGGEAGRAGCAGRGEVPSDSPAVVRTELTLLSFPLTAACTVRKLNPVAAWSTRLSAGALLRAVRAGVRCAEPFGMGHCGLLGWRSVSPGWRSHLDIPQCFSRCLNVSQDLASVNTVTSVSPLFQDGRWLGGQLSCQEPSRNCVVRTNSGSPPPALWCSSSKWPGSCFCLQ